MDFIIGVGAIILVVAVIAAIALIGFIFPTEAKNHMEQRYGLPIISTWWAAIQAIITIGFVMETSSPDEAPFWILLFVMLATCIVSIWRCIAKAKRVEASQRDIVLSCIAQICYAFGVIIALALLFAIFDNSKKKKR